MTRDRSDGCRILHVDMDAFFASVAIRERPDLAGRPVLIGGGNRGVVLCATYEARRYGVHSAMPMVRARRLCPQAVIVSPDYTDFDTVSRSVMEIFRQVTAQVEPVSLDEAFLDVSGALRRFGSPLEIARHLRARVHEEQRITCSVGVATTTSVAKLASRRAKPDGVVVVPADRVTTFLHPLDVGELYGVGAKTRSRLQQLGLMTVGDVAQMPLPVLQRALGKHAGAHVHGLAWGEGGRTVGSRPGFGEPDKTMGNEETFGRDTADPDVVLREVLRLSAKVAGRVRRAGLAGRTVSLKVRYSDFRTLTRSRTLAEGTDVTSEIYQAAAGLFAALGSQQPRIRLVGVRLEGLVPRESVHRQLVLGARERGWSEADRAVDAALQRFGGHAVRPATLLVGDRP